MKSSPGLRLLCALAFCWWIPAGAVSAQTRANLTSKTHVAIVGDEIYFNGKPTYAGRVWHGRKVQGLLLNSPMVQSPPVNWGLNSERKRAFFNLLSEITSAKP